MSQPDVGSQIESSPSLLSTFVSGIAVKSVVSDQFSKDLECWFSKRQYLTFELTVAHNALKKAICMAGNPKLHVLIAGISAYPHLPEPNDPAVGRLGLRQLSSPAISAFTLYEWILQNQADLPFPLGSCQLLLCPSDVELNANPTLATANTASPDKKIFRPCTLDNFLDAAAAWRVAAATDPNNITWFFFSGHGVQRTNSDAVLLLEDFGQPTGGVLRNAVDLNNIFSGMAPAPNQPNIAKTQFYFIDACRIPPQEFEKVEKQDTTQVFEVELGGKDDRKAPIFFATISGGAAAGFAGRASIFTSILRQCLDGSAGEQFNTAAGDGWHVTSFSTVTAMSELLSDYKEDGIDQEFAMSGLTHGNPQIRKLPKCPEVDVLIDVDPAPARQVASIQVFDALSLGLMPLPNPMSFPCSLRWSAGTYRFLVVVPQPPYLSPPAHVQTLLPPRSRIVRKVVP